MKTPDPSLTTDKTSFFQDSAAQLTDLAVAYAPRLGLALVVLVVGWIVIRLVRRAINRVLTSRRLDATVSSFLGSVVGVGLWLVLGMSVAGMVGVQVTSFVAIATAATFAVGMALKSTLQNFFAGVLILIKRPFVVGDFIECAGDSGTVREIRFFDTLVTTGDNKTVIVPNNDLATKVVTNFSAQSTRRVQVIVGIGYGDDIDVAREIILGLLKADKRVHQDPEPAVVVKELGSSSVDIQTRVWVDAPDYWGVTWQFNEDVKKAFDRAGISIPYPQMTVHRSES